MRSWVIAFLFFISFSAGAQKIRISNHENAWLTYGVNFDGCIFYHGITFGADTILSGHSYEVVKDHWYVDSMPPACGVIGGFSIDTTYFIREDTVSNIVYFRRIVADTAEHILYNYNLNLGDTFISHYSAVNYSDTGNYTDSVASLDSLIIDGVYHKLYNFINIRPGYERRYNVLEGIGCLNNPFFTIYMPGCFEYLEDIQCFSQNGHYPIINIPDSIMGFACASQHSFLANTCALGVEKVFENAQKITISPNPTHDFFRVNNLPASVSYQLLNIMATIYKMAN